MLEPDRVIAHHAVARVAWLRAAAMRANAGLVGLGALLVGVAAAAASEGEVLLAGLAGLVAGAVAIAMGEFAAAANPVTHTLPDRAADPVNPLVVHPRRGPDHDLIATAGGGMADYRGAPALQVGITSAASFGLGAAVPLAAASVFRLPAMPLGIALVTLPAVALIAVSDARAAGLAATPGVARAVTWAGGGLALAFALGRLVGTALI